MEELHVDDVQQLLVQLTDVNDVAGQEAGLRSVDEIQWQTRSQLQNYTYKCVFIIKQNLYISGNYSVNSYN